MDSQFSSMPINQFLQRQIIKSSGYFLGENAMNPKDLVSDGGKIPSFSSHPYHVLEFLTFSFSSLSLRKRDEFLRKSSVFPPLCSILLQVEHDSDFFLPSNDINCSRVSRELDKVGDKGILK
ncbi:hypothetical protein CEXT_381401 [Caerostris extrusa]|uniref:Maturase K n=1 Tax=Caerostris extrusa TaxID=172846 RepID=A0AAV4R7V7_CAEEX|nr:hypothetical protein CEXT_381401 [Caerostris extrusa]